MPCSPPPILNEESGTQPVDHLARGARFFREAFD